MKSSKRKTLPANGSAGRDKAKAFKEAIMEGGPGVSKSGLARVLRSLAQSGFLASELLGLEGDEDQAGGERTIRRRLTASTSSSGQERTPYGTVIQTMPLHLSMDRKKKGRKWVQVPSANPKDVDWQYVNPFAFLHYACSISDEFATIIASIATGELSILLYMDEARPGNILRPDSGRLFLAIHWTFLEFPEHLRHRDIGWIPFGFLRKTIYERMPGEMSNLCRHILKVFYSSTGFNMLDGCRCVVGGRDIYLRAKFAGFLGDEKAIKEIYNIKGSSGNKPCICCKNVIGKKADVSSDAYFVSLDTSSYQDLDRHTDESVFEMVDILQNAKHNGAGKGRVDELCKAMGLNDSVESLLFDASLRAVVRPVSGTCWDWMHVLVSNGLADVEVSLFCRAMWAQGIKKSQVDEFMEEFRGMKCKLTKEFLAKRLKGDKLDDEEFSGFAGELMVLVPLLRQFCEMVLLPLGALVRHAECFVSLSNIVELMALGDKAVEHTLYLRREIQRHHRLFIELYGIDATTPKFHYTLHLPDVLDELQRNVSCWVGERKHRLPKTSASRVFNEFETSLLSECLTNFVHEMKPADAFGLERLANDVPLDDPSLLGDFHQCFPGLVAVFANKSATTAIGQVKHRALLLLSTNHGFQIGEVLLFFKLVCRGGFCKFLACFTLFEQVSPGKCRRCPGNRAIYETRCIQSQLMYAELDDSQVRIVEPIQVRQPWSKGP